MEQQRLAENLVNADFFHLRNGTNGTAGDSLVCQTFTPELRISFNLTLVEAFLDEIDALNNATGNATDAPTAAPTTPAPTVS